MGKKSSAFFICRYLPSIATITEEPENQNLVSTISQESGRRSILELDGLGQEIWQGIDAQMYINEERDSWNG